MPDLADGETAVVPGSGGRTYKIKNVGGVYSCDCPAWRNQSLPIERRTCKHIGRYRGDAAEEARLGAPALPPRKPAGDVEAREGPPLLLAERWDSETDLAGWWMSEKLDGIRAYWDGKQFLSRQGNLFIAPDWFLQGLPKEPLDGELWIARKAFQRTSGIVRRQDKTELWREVRYIVFDAPAHPDDFETRLQFIRECIDREKPPFAIAHSHEPCLGLDHLRSELERIGALGGEGLMLREPRSKYEAGRSPTLLKVKNFLDAEARVVGHKAGAGRHEGRLGALTVELADGTRFDVGTGFSDAEREVPPPVGSVIAFRYQELSEGGVPRFPSYIGLREDAGAGALPPEALSRRKATTMVRTAAKATKRKAARPGKRKAAPKRKATTAAKRKATRPARRKPSAPARRPAGRAPSLGGRRFELLDGSSSKFWVVAVHGKSMTTHWGRIGSDGQSKTKAFASPAAAAGAAAKLIEEKTSKGYVEVR
jgi:DNA ligase-1